MSDRPCPHPREPLSLYLDGEGGPLLRMQVALRLRRCAACRAALVELRAADQWAAAVAVEPSPGLEEALLATARAIGAPMGRDNVAEVGADFAAGLPPARIRWYWRPVLGAAATVAVVIAVGIGNGWWASRPGDELFYTDLALFEEMDLIARLDMVEHFDEIQGVRLD